MSKTPINDYKVVLREVITRVANCRKVNQYSNDYVLYTAKKKIPLGQSDNFEAEIHIPQQAIGYTAIGNIISRTYELCLIG
jgi:hypothetical protein